jgi:hypothetical protein
MMDALQAAQRIYDSTFRNLADKTLELDVDTALAIATFCATLAQAEQSKRIADALYFGKDNVEIADILHAIYEKLDEVKS